MKRCWLEGEWRAYCDRELPPEEMAAAAEHLAECPACEERHRDVARRAARVAAWMSEMDGADAVAPRVTAMKPRRRAWVPAAVAAGIAAALIAGLWLWPRGTRSQAVTLAPAAVGNLAVKTPPAPAPSPDPVRVAPTPAPRRAVRAAVPVKRPPRQPAETGAMERVDYFVALDNDPLDSGVIVRMALDGGRGPQADVLFDSAGRARAVRPVKFNVKGAIR